MPEVAGLKLIKGTQSGLLGDFCKKYTCQITNANRSKSQKNVYTITPYFEMAFFFAVDGAFIAGHIHVGGLVGKCFNSSCTYTRIRAS